MDVIETPMLPLSRASSRRIPAISNRLHPLTDILRNATFLGLGLAAIDLAVRAADCVPPVPGLVTWLRAEGNALDTVSSSPVTLVNGATFAPGLAGQAFRFDGVDDYVLVPDSPNWALGTSDFTIEVWTKFNRVKNSMLVYQLNGTARGGFEFDFQAPGGASPSVLGFAIDPSSFGIVRPWTPAADTWYHLAVTRTAGAFRLYVDGQQLGAEQFDTRPVATVSGPLELGNYELAGYALDGFIDELSIYRQALTSAQITALHTAGAAGKCVPPTLRIESLPGAVRLSWTTNATGFALETNGPAFAPAAWSQLGTAPAVVADEFVVTNVISSPVRLYRLKKP